MARGGKAAQGAYDFGVEIELPVCPFEGRAADFYVGYSVAIGVLRNWADSHPDASTRDMLVIAAAALSDTRADIVTGMQAMIDVRSEGFL